MKKFIILDWCNNICFDEKEFDSFEDAWSFIYEYYKYLPDNEAEDQFGEFEVIEKEDL